MAKRPNHGDWAERQVDWMISGAHLEERCLRYIDALVEELPVDQLAHGSPVMMLMQARKCVQEAFLWTQKAITNPPRMKLPEDVQE